MNTNLADVYRSDGERFERLVFEILSANKLLVESTAGMNSRFDLKPEVDLILQLQNKRIAIEVKFFRTVVAIKNLVNQAASRLAATAANGNYAGGMLVVSSVVDEAHKDAVSERWGIFVADALTLRGWVARSPELSARLEQTLPADRDAMASSADVYDRQRVKPGVPPLSGHLFEMLSKPKPSGSPSTKGHDLCRELRNLPTGKRTAAKFETLGTKIFEYLFDDGLDWSTHRPQSRTADGLHIFDLVCRVKGGTAFWNFVLQECHTRYMVFELKNYAEKIGQNQVYSTEKYLFREAFRSVAVVFSRKGPSTNAVEATCGAMRDAEKLLIHVNDDQVCEMLHIRDRNDDPADYLFGLVDKFLMSLSR
jgi:hypothetical protein